MQARKICCTLFLKDHRSFKNMLMEVHKEQVSFSCSEWINNTGSRIFIFFQRKFVFYCFWKTFLIVPFQFVIFKLLSYCFEETIGFDVKATFVSRPMSYLIRWYNKIILIKGYSVPRDFSWIENYKLFCY